MAAVHWFVTGGLQDAIYALFAFSARDALAHNVAPVSVSLNDTVEVGWAAPEFASVKVAAKVTAWFTEEGDSEEVTTIVRGAGLTVCVTLLELVTKFASPLYLAVIV